MLMTAMTDIALQRRVPWKGNPKPAVRPAQDAYSHHAPCLARDMGMSWGVSSLCPILLCLVPLCAMPLAQVSSRTTTKKMGCPTATSYLITSSSVVLDPLREHGEVDQHCEVRIRFSLLKVGPSLAEYEGEGEKATWKGKWRRSCSRRELQPISKMHTANTCLLI